MRFTVNSESLLFFLCVFLSIVNKFYNSYCNEAHGSVKMKTSYHLAHLPRNAKMVDHDFVAYNTMIRPSDMNCHDFNGWCRDIIVVLSEVRCRYEKCRLRLNGCINNSKWPISILLKCTYNFSLSVCFVRNGSNKQSNNNKGRKIKKKSVKAPCL